MSGWDDYLASVAQPSETTPAKLEPVTTKRPAADLGIVSAGGAVPLAEKPLHRMSKDELKALQLATNAACMREHFLPVGSEGMLGRRGVWRVWVADDPEADPPF